jgi:hypothetical protein
LSVLTTAHATTAGGMDTKRRAGPAG